MNGTLHAGMPRPKRIYFVRPHPSLAAGRFTERWREHGRLAMQFMQRQGWRNVVRYVHCDAVDVPQVPNARSWAGMGIVVFRDAEARKDHLSFAQARKALEADEDLAFADRVNRSGLVALEQVVLERGTQALKLVRAHGRPQAMGEGEFRRRFEQEQVPRTHEAAGARLVRHALNWPLPPEDGRAWGLDCALVEELWFRSVEDLLAALAAERQSHSGELLCPIFELVTRETVLHPPPAQNGTRRA